MAVAGIQVADLIDHPQHVPLLARWMWESWDCARGWTLDQSYSIHVSRADWM